MTDRVGLVADLVAHLSAEQSTVLYRHLHVANAVLTPKELQALACAAAEQQMITAARFAASLVAPANREAFLEATADRFARNLKRRRSDILAEVGRACEATLAEVAARRKAAP